MYKKNIANVSDIQVDDWVSLTDWGESYRVVSPPNLSGVL
jgi:hypothetical protein